MNQHPILFLGPQRVRPGLRSALDELGLRRKLAVVTAGWQERESEVEALREHLECELVELRLHQRVEQLFRDDPELFDAHRRKQDRLRERQRYYRYRLDFALAPIKELMKQDGRRGIVRSEREDAIAQVRALDARHVHRLEETHSRFAKEVGLRDRAGVVRQRDEIEELLQDCSALLIAGGHVAVLINRLRLTGFGSEAPPLPVVAWSAGAMVLTRRIVLFHDFPPQGEGNEEVLDLGLGWVPDVVALPHARQRLRLEEPHRVAAFARRFAPDRCLLLDGDSRVLFGDRSPSDSAEGGSEGQAADFFSRYRWQGPRGGLHRYHGPARDDRR